MADSVVEIVNTTLTSTELPDSDTSYTLLTTDANTSYVIKSVQVNTLISDLNLQTYINDFDVGDWGQDLTGFEVMDVSSTLKVKSSSFPIDLNHVLHSYRNGTDYVEEEIGTLSGLSLQTNTTTFPTTLSGVLNSRTGSNARSGFVTSGDKIYQVEMDSNVNQDIRYWSDSSASPVAYSVQNYSPLWVAPELDAIFFESGSGQLNKITLSTGVQSTVSTNLQGTSTYVRFAHMNGYLFYMPQTSGGTALVYAHRATDGVKFLFNGLQGITYGEGTKLAVSYNKATDKFYVYRTNNATDGPIEQDILPITKTEMDAYTSDTTITTATERAVGQAITNYGISDTEYGSTIAGHPTDGDKFYGAQYVTGNTNFDIVYCSFSNGTAVKQEDGNGGTGPILNAIVPTAAQVTAFNYDTPPSAINIRFTGVKTTS